MTCADSDILESITTPRSHVTQVVVWSRMSVSDWCWSGSVDDWIQANIGRPYPYSSDWVSVWVEHTHLTLSLQHRDCIHNINKTLHSNCTTQTLAKGQPSSSSSSSSSSRSHVMWLLTLEAAWCSCSWSTYRVALHRAQLLLWWVTVCWQGKPSLPSLRVGEYQLG